MVKSSFTGKSYDPAKCCRIVNMLQLAFYLDNDVELLDLYVSKDYKTNKPMLVGIVSKENSYEAYNLWCTNKENNTK